MEENAHILLVDDEPSMRTTLSILLKREGYEVSQAGDGDQALEMLERDHYDMVLTDLKMKRMDGMKLLREAKAVSPYTEILIFTAYGTVDSAVEAMKSGAYDYLNKPFDEEELLMKVRRALERKSLVREVRKLKQELKRQRGIEGDIIAKSKGMTEVLDKVAQVAPTRATVLIQGASGTGKEIVARAIHQASARSDSPFIPVNCSNLPETLLESELFGYEKGAFTGAHSSHKGLFEAAHMGSLLMDEIGDMPKALQGKILRVIEEGEIKKLGQNRPLKVDVRILAATNKNIGELVSQGAFREDLFHRLNVVRVVIPPLRERPDDIVPLAYHFLEIYGKSTEKEIKGFSNGAVQAMLGYPWPGNVRELKNAVERAVIIARSPYITRNDLSLEFSKSPSDEPLTLDSIQRRHIISTLKRHGGNQAKAARELGIGRNTLWRWLRKHDFSG